MTDSILTRIKALLAKASSTTNAHEAAAFAEKANEPIEKYQISADAIRDGSAPVMKPLRQGNDLRLPACVLRLRQRRWNVGNSEARLMGRYTDTLFKWDRFAGTRTGRDASVEPRMHQLPKTN